MTIESIANQLRAAATRQLNQASIHPLRGYTDRHGRTPKPWAQGEWKVFLNRAEQVPRAIEYVEANPEKESRPRQSWPFVTPFPV